MARKKPEPKAAPTATASRGWCDEAKILEMYQAVCSYVAGEQGATDSGVHDPDARDELLSRIKHLLSDEERVQLFTSFFAVSLGPEQRAAGYDLEDAVLILQRLVEHGVTCKPQRRRPYK